MHRSVPTDAWPHTTELIPIKRQAWFPYVKEHMNFNVYELILYEALRPLYFTQIMKKYDHHVYSMSQEDRPGWP
jgi:hypothetical protein